MLKVTPVGRASSGQTCCSLAPEPTHLSLGFKASMLKQLNLNCPCSDASWAQLRQGQHLGLLEMTISQHYGLGDGTTDR